MARHSQFSAELKAKVALAAIKKDKTLNELAKEFKVSPSQITKWKQEAIAHLTASFAPVPPKQTKELEKMQKEKEKMLKKIGQLELEVDFFAEACEKAGLVSRGKH